MSEVDVASRQIEATESALNPSNPVNTATRLSSRHSHINRIPQMGLTTPSTEEFSHDDTNLLSSRGSFGSTSHDAQVPHGSADCFPVFKTGDVIIRTELGYTPQTFQLHSAVLSRHAPWFARAFQSTAWKESRRPCYFFTIKDVNGKVILVQGDPKGERPTFSHSRQPEVIDGVMIKTEDVPDDSIACYTQILGAFYSIPPRISIAEISTALTCSEELVEIASELGCLHLLRPQVGNVLSQHRQKLFLAIKNDPPRWAKLALALENKSIYAECVIHLIGAHPRWPWGTPRNKLPEDLQRLVKCKAADLETATGVVERNLLLTTIPYGWSKNAPDPTNRGQTETWMVVSVFRDQLAQRIDAIDRDRRGVLERGAFFRSIRKGTLSELDPECIRSICQDTLKCAWTDLNADLKRLKDYAAQLVEDLAANELMVDPDANGIGYLTCSKVKDEDVPWLASV